MLICLGSTAQPHQHHYQLKLNDRLKLLSGSAQLEFVNNTNRNLDTVFIHLPPRSLQWKGSLLHRQFIKFQNVDAYYADQEELGYIHIDSIKSGHLSFQNLKTDEGEFLGISLGGSLVPGEKVTFEIDFKIKIPDSRFNGTGYDGDVYRLANWLPRFAMLDSSGWHLHPVTYQNDIYQNFDDFYITLDLEDEFVIATNGEIQTRKENSLYKELTLNPYSKRTGTGGRKEVEIHFRQTISPQLFLSKNFRIHRINDSVRMFSSKVEPQLPLIHRSADSTVNAFLANEIGQTFSNRYDVVMLEKKVGEYQSDHLLSIEYPKKAFDFNADLAHARAQQLFRYQIAQDGYSDVWLARGLPYFYRHKFVKEVFPDKKWLPFSNSFVGRFFDLDEFSYDYQNQFLYLYLARQGLDQAMSTSADSLSRLNYEAIVQAKAYLSFSHLYHYMGERDFKRSLHRYVRHQKGTVSGPEQLKSAMKYYHFQELNWFFDSLVISDNYIDYQVVKYDRCPTVTTLTVDNEGDLSIPYSVTAFRNNKPIHTEWLPGHKGRKTVQLYHIQADKVVINHHQTAPEFSLRNNQIRTKGILKKTEPIRLQIGNGFENMEKTQIFIMPSGSFNAYDKILAGITFYNRSLVNKPLEYSIGPEYSTGTGKITGYGSLLWNITPNGSPFHRISAGLFGRYRHYDEGLSYFRISPALNFYFRRSYAESDILQKLRLRAVTLQRELPDKFDVVPNSLSHASYTVFTTNYRLENINVLNPFTLNLDLQIGEQFIKWSMMGDHRWMLPNKRWLIWRYFGGVFIKNKYASEGINNNFYSFGLSGTRDYLFDYELIGRSEESGIWSRQFFITDGGFKSETGVFADKFILTTGLTVPIWTIFGVFGDAGYVDNTKTLYWDYGGRISVFTDFLEFYFPFANQDRNFLQEPNYLKNVRFVLNLDLSEIIGRIRRGYY